MSEFALKDVIVVVFRNPGCTEEGEEPNDELTFVGETIAQARDFVNQHEWSKRDMRIETRAALVVGKTAVLVDAIEMGAQPLWKTKT